MSVDLQVLNHLVIGNSAAAAFGERVLLLKDRRWLLITLPEELALRLGLGPRKEAKILIILLLPDRSGIKRSSFLYLAL